MTSVISLALPFFGLIFLGYFCGKLMKYSEEGLRWMNFFIVYVSLPCLFFKLIGATPLEELINWRFVIATSLTTYTIFILSFIVGILATPGKTREATIQAVAGAYSNIGYMGPGLTLTAIGAGASGPTALIFVFDNIIFFSLVPFMMALSGNQPLKVWQTTKHVLFKIFTHPFNVATLIGILAALLHWKPPEALDTMIVYLKNAAAPCALFTLGVTVALRPMKRMPIELPLHLAIKLILHPVLVLVVLSLLGNFERDWVYTAILMAALPPALNIYVLARQYDVYVEEASSIVLVGTLVSVVTVTALLYFISNKSLPVSLF